LISILLFFNIFFFFKPDFLSHFSAVVSIVLL
jgi:hypothetical protein